MLEFIHELRDAERALTKIHMVTWIKRNQRAWFVSYLANKKPGTGYNSFLLLVRLFSARLLRQRPGTSKRSQEDLEDTRDIFEAEFHREYRAHGSESVYNVDETDIYYDMPPNYIWAVRGGSSKISSGDKHSMRMTEALTAKADGTKDPILFIMKGVPGGRIEANEFPTFPAGHSYAVQEKAGMDGRVWKSYLHTVLHDDIEEATVILVDNFESYVSEASYKIINEELGSHLCPLPPNSTSMCQPLDVGVTAPFKRHLRELWLYEDIITGDDDDPFSLTARQKRLVLIK
ncbi:hypothetical protein DYB31_009136 [Aphanomyces astaci]|uniref:DDE-1 domain-containing protein n=1 Tax=Aphanomyces astaci TaxID=112090 RepID=A0A397ER04_APHAT|nr:hypothetical protein DYB31_009136 [Aphanomyces astaci]